MQTQSQNMNKKNWVELFRAAGLKDAEMSRWHHEFEHRYPEGHQEFLEWIGIPVAEIKKIREDSRHS